MSDISIIIPVYNAELYIKRCLDSILKNKKYVSEVILIDDGSIDKSAEICKEYEKKYSFIKYFYQKNSGPSSARNKGLELANCKYIMFIDSDDYIGNIKEIKKILESYNGDYYIFPNIYKIIKNKENINYIKIKDDKYFLKDNKEKLKKLIKDEIINSPCSKIYKKEIIDKNKIKFNINYNMAEDLLFNMNYVKFCNNFIINKKAFYYYCFNNVSSLTQKYLKNKYEMLMKVDEELKKIFEQMGIVQMYDYLVYKNIYSSIKDFRHIHCKLSKEEKILKIKNYKKENRKKIILNCGLKMAIWSIIFTLLPAQIIYKFIKIGG